MEEYTQTSNLQHIINKFQRYRDFFSGFEIPQKTRDKEIIGVILVRNDWLFDSGDVLGRCF